MVTQINIDSKWGKDILDLADRFNNYAQKGSLRMVSFLIDKAFEVLSNDKNPNQLDAAYFLVQVRSLNPNLISPYISTLIDAKIGQKLLDSDQYIIPDYIKYPISDKHGTHVAFSESASDPKVIEDNETNHIEITDSDEIKDDEIESSETEAIDEGETQGGLLNWDINALITFKIIKNVQKINYDKIKSPIKKCAAGDGVFEKDDENIWRCKECGTAYHENCVKIIAILEGNCRICEAPLLEEGMQIDNIVEEVRPSESEEEENES